MTKWKAVLCAAGAAAFLSACGDAPAGEDAARGPAAPPEGEAFDPASAPVTWDPGPFASAWDQYEARRAQADNPGDLDPESMPDWSGVWEQAAFQGFPFGLRPGEAMLGRGFATGTTMQLTPAYAAEREARIRQAEEGHDFDPLTWCLPAGYPRWFVEPFMRDFYPHPGTTLLINEMQNEVRRIYTDGRGHISPDFAYPLWEGDSIGFWDGDTLVVHTNNLKHNLLQREQPAISDRAETYEEWRKAADGVIQVKVSLYDTEALTAPHHFVRYYQKVDDQDGELRIAYWSCEENQPVVRTAQGGSDFGAIPGTDGALDLTDAETWLMFDEAEQAGLTAEFEAAAAGAQTPAPAPAE